MMRKRQITIIRHGKTLTFVALLASEGRNVTARIQGMHGLIAVGDDDDHAIKQLQGALIFHLDGCDEDGIDPFANDPDVPGLDDVL